MTIESIYIDFGDNGAPVGYRFGKPTEAQFEKHPRLIPHYFRSNCPEELQKLLRDIYDWEFTWPVYYASGAGMEFGYGDKSYRIKPATFDIDDAIFENHTLKILETLEAFGCNYGGYMGFLD